MLIPEYPPIIASKRAELWDFVYHGSFAVATPKGMMLHKHGDPKTLVYTRSAVKAIQSVPLIIGGGIEKFGMTEAELAVICSSHNGESIHIEAVQSILTKAQIPIEALMCAVDKPISKTEQARLIREGSEYSRLHCDCSGKHAGGLATCQLYNWHLADYCSPDHILQKTIADLLAKVTGCQREEVKPSIDGCGYTNYSVTLEGLATAAAKIAYFAFTQPSPSETAPWIESMSTDKHKGYEIAQALGVAGRACNLHPEMVGGLEFRPDTVLMRALPNTCFAKVGAGGIWAIGVKLDDQAFIKMRQCGIGIPQTERTIGFAIKISDGDLLARVRYLALVKLMVDWGILRAEHFTANPDLGRLADPANYNERDEITGFMVPLFSSKLD